MTQTNSPAVSHSDRIRQLAETRRRILSMPAEQAMDAILDHPQPSALVHSFPEEDLHFLIHDLGTDNALPLISLASTRQWDYLLDMEVWKKDQLNYPQATTWLQLLLRADPDRLVKWCFDERLEFLELYLFRNIELRVRESDLFSSDFDDGFFTDDDTFYVRFVDYPATTPEAEAAKSRRNEMLSQLLRRISIFDHPRYQGLLMESVSLIPSEIEEELFRLRNVRLAEKGFLPFHEAVGVYQPLQPRELAARGKKAIRPPSPDDPRFPEPQFAATFLEGDNLFVRALKGINEGHVIQQLQGELAGLCNQVISADQTIIVGRNQLKSVVSKVSGYLSIGLELMTDSIINNPAPMASALLQRHLLADIFRTGFGSALQLKWQAIRWRKDSWFQSQSVDLTFWDEAWLGLLGGLLIDTPQFYDPSNAGSNYRDFLTREEIEATGRGLGQIIAIDQLLKGMDLTIAPIVEIRFLTYKNLLLTLWVRALLKAPPVNADTSTLAVSLSAFKEIYASLWTDHEGQRIIGDGKKAEFLHWAAEASGQSSDDLSDRLGTVFEALFDEIQRELASVESGNLDPRHLYLFLLKH
ncbi:DUF6178 family protein [uncultured Desulfosarcina sp.]|uniref:DUF6178 family protein n=1 Tax=uncultured Desulfosarcina sp. TaxID=218289 RepID=UPI0029C62A9B|nr:DUF6178 family protein [uncultured Desulfosarcina sp.]